MRNKLKILAILAAWTSGTVRAETIWVSGWYAAGNRDVAMLHSLSMDRFEGNEGPSLASAIERSLIGIQDRAGGRYFDIRSGYSSSVDGIVSGSMQVRTENAKFKRKVKRCAADTGSIDCKDDAKVEIEQKCTRRIVTAAVDVKIHRLSDDSLIYSRSLPQRNQVEYCEDDDLPPGVDTIVMPFINSIAATVRSDTAPYGAREKFRIRETRSGLSKTDSSQMKSLILVTDKNPAAACAGWGEMAARGVSHATLSFNLGLCAESAGELDRALSYYQTVASSGKPAADVRDAIDRVQRHMAGLADDAERETAKGPKGQ